MKLKLQLYRCKNPSSPTGRGTGVPGAWALTLAQPRQARPCLTSVGVDDEMPLDARNIMRPRLRREQGLAGASTSRHRLTPPSGLPDTC